MKFLSTLLFGATLLAVPGALAAADKSSTLTIKNNTNLTLHGVLWQGDAVHLNHNGPEWQYGTISPKGNAKADVPSCKFSVVFWDDKDLWHFEIHDCHSETLTIGGKNDVNHVTLK